MPRHDYKSKLYTIKIQLIDDTRNLFQDQSLHFKILVGFNFMRLILEGKIAHYESVMVINLSRYTKTQA